jgi:beta-xylosidase
VATLKHFVGYSASRGGRNLAPVSAGPREVADVLLPPFEHALRDGGARSVMNAYTDTDGIPAAADADLLTGLLRDTWGFTGTVVADYFAIAFLKMLHGVAGTWGEAAAAALRAGIDVELPTVHTFGEPLLAAVRDGVLDEAVIDRALTRVLLQKHELGLLDPDWDPVPPVLRGADLDHPEALRGTVDLDPPDNRALAREIAEQAVVLLKNDGVLPLTAPGRIAVIGPNADTWAALLGCYSFPAHIGVHHPEAGLGIELPTVLQAVRSEFPESEVVHAAGTSIDGGETHGIADAVALAADSDVVVLALGDRAGLFGRGTSGEGCDVASLNLPGAQQQLLDALLDSGTPIVVALLTGRPYALGRAVTEAAAILQAFFPGEEGAPALARVLSGAVNPSGRLPVSIPRSPGAQPSTYLVAQLGQASTVSSIDPGAAYPFGHGLSYTEFAWTDASVVSDRASTDGTIEVSLTVRNTGDRAGADVVQLYLHDPLASVVRPVQRLIGFAKVTLDAGAAARVSVRVPADLTSFTGADLRRIVEPGELVFGFGRSSGDIPLVQSVQLTGETRVVDHTRALHPVWSVEIL